LIKSQVDTHEVEVKTLLKVKKKKITCKFYKGERIIGLLDLETIDIKDILGV
jgi:Mg2+/Co2+ transporter CorB